MNPLSVLAVNRSGTALYADTLCVFRKLNHLTCSVEMFHSFWLKDRDVGQNCSEIVKTAFQSIPTGLKNKKLILRTVTSKSFFDLAKSTLTSLLETINKSCELTQYDSGDDLIIRNPNKVKTKGRPKIGCNDMFPRPHSSDRNERFDSHYQLVHGQKHLLDCPWSTL